MPDFTHELDYALRRLINETGTAEGPQMPPRQQAGVRVPSVSGLKIAKTEFYFGGTQVTLTWREPYENQFISGYNVQVLGLLDDNKQPIGPYYSKKSPAQIRVQTKTTARVTFVVQTVLNNGMTSDITQSPSVSTIILSSNIVANDIPDGIITVPDLADGTPGALISWNNFGVATTTGPGAVNEILAGNGVASVPLFRTRAALDLVTGSSALTTAGAVPYVTSTGTVGSSSVYWDSVNSFLGVGTVTPAATVHAYQSMSGSAVTVVQSATIKETTYQNSIGTTDALGVSMHTLVLNSDTTTAIEVTVVARRTGGASGTAEDGARYKLWATYKNVAGVATLLGTVSKIEDEDQPAWDCYFTVSGGAVLVNVIGATNNNITWKMTMRVYES